MRDGFFSDSNKSITCLIMDVLVSHPISGIFNLSRHSRKGLYLVTLWPLKEQYFIFTVVFHTKNR